MLDKNCVLGWGQVEHDLYEEDGHVFGIELDLFNGHTSFYYKNDRFFEYLNDDIYEAIDQYNTMLPKDNLTLKDILPNNPVDITVRTNDPFGKDMLVGYCHWTGTELISGDGDSYSIDDEVSEYLFDDYGYRLVYWFNSKWS